MKARLDFVSNSSSSSFIVISDKGKRDLVAPEYETIVLPCKNGERYFGWQTARYYDFWSKLNWCSIIVATLRSYENYDTSSEKLETQIKKPWFNADDMEKMLKDVCKREFGLDVELMSSEDQDQCDEMIGIDHQSNVGEQPKNARMFISEKMLIDFLTNDHSFIDNSNDNSGRDNEEFDTSIWRPKSIPNDYEM